MSMDMAEGGFPIRHANKKAPGPETRRSVEGEANWSD